MLPHDEETQRMHWRVKDAERAGVARDVVAPMMRELAGRYEAAAEARFAANDLMAWSDVFAAITWWARAGERSEAVRVLEGARGRARRLAEGENEVLAELDRLNEWMSRPGGVASGLPANAADTMHAAFDAAASAANDPTDRAAVFEALDAEERSEFDVQADAPIAPRLWLLAAVGT